MTFVYFDTDLLSFSSKVNFVWHFSEGCSLFKSSFQKKVTLFWSLYKQINFFEEVKIEARPTLISSYKGDQKSLQRTSWNVTLLTSPVCVICKLLLLETHFFLFKFDFVRNIRAKINSYFFYNHIVVLLQYFWPWLIGGLVWPF